MSARPFHKRYHSDALAGMMALTLEERGAYQTLLDLIYDRGGPIADNERLLAGYMGCSVRKWRQLREALLEKRKIHLTSGGEISNVRAEKELENDAKTSRKLAENGSKGGKSRAENHEKYEKGNEINDGDQAPLEPGLSRAQAYARVPEARSHIEKKKNPPTPPRFDEQSAEVRRVLAAGGFVSLPNDTGLVRTWLELQDMDLERDIVPLVERMAGEEMARRGRRPFSLKFFDGAIREQHAADMAEIERLKLARARIERLDEEQRRVG